tara:strand:- start:4582 stop:5796 length:1215 start_codon:yes stop_codon:yes gene_type:complete
MNNKAFIHEIHDSPVKLVLVTAGGGSEAISELLRYGRGSDTVLDLRVPYVQKAFRQVVRNDPEKYVSAAAARNIAVAAYEHAVDLEEKTDNVWGIGCTSALVKDGEKPYPDGTTRKHRIYISAHSENKTVSWGVILKNGRSREDEERINALLILEIIGKISGVHEHRMQLLRDGDESHEEIVEAPDPVAALCNNVLIDNHKLWVEVRDGDFEGCNLYANPQSHVHTTGEHIIFSGSFNPRHPGHKEMVEAAIRFKTDQGTPCAVDYEISVRNADKPTLDYVSLAARSKQFGEGEKVWLTTASTFVEKSRLFPNTTFLVGLDTFMRIGDRKYYDNPSKAFLELTGNKTRFLVAHRQSDKYSFPIPQGFPEELLQMADFLPESYYNDPEAESSTTARKNGNTLEKF